MKQTFSASRRKAGAILTGAAIVSALCAGVARAATTISPTTPGDPPVVRADSLNINVSGGNIYTRSTNNTTPNPTGLYTKATGWTNSVVLGAFLPGLSCLGNNPPAAANTPNNWDNSPRSRVVVAGPDGVVHDETGPAKSYDLLNPSDPGTVIVPQPAPAKLNNLGGSWTAKLDLAGATPGVYTIETTTTNVVRSYTASGNATSVPNNTSFSPNQDPNPNLPTNPTTGSALTATSQPVCQIGTPVSRESSTTGFGNQYEPGLVVETMTFEYRPWQHIFKDILGGGNVSMNVDPAEYQTTVNGNTGQLRGGGTMQFFAVPAADTIALPADPAACAADPASCLPALATACDPSAGCDPRIGIINHNDPSEATVGVFDFETGAFIAYTKVNGVTRVQLSLGSDIDPQIKDALAGLIAQADAAGVPLSTLLGTKVRLRLANGSSSTEITVSLLEGLQIVDNAPAGPTGVNVIAPAKVDAGLMFHLAIWSNAPNIDGGAGTITGDTDPNTPAPDRFATRSHRGYAVKRSDIVPNLPALGLADGLVPSGPLYSIKADYRGPGTSAPINLHTPAIGVSTAPDEPNGLPAWIAPVSGVPLGSDAVMDFLGFASWSASETCDETVCSGVDTMLGIGVGLFSAQPLPLSFADIPLLWEPNAAAADVHAQLNAVLSEVLSMVLGNETVAGILDPIVDQVLGVVEIPSL